MSAKMPPSNPGQYLAESQQYHREETARFAGADAKDTNTVKAAIWYLRQRRHDVVEYQRLANGGCWAGADLDKYDTAHAKQLLREEESHFRAAVGFLARFGKLYGVDAVPLADGMDESICRKLEIVASVVATENRADAPHPTRSDGGAKPKGKRSTEKGEATEKLIAALCVHHKFAMGGALNLRPIGSNELARQAEVEKSSASYFFKTKFGGHSAYKVRCRNGSELAVALKALRGEFSPIDLFGTNPPSDAERND